MYIKIEKRKYLEFFTILVFLFYGFTIGWEGKISPVFEYYLNRVLYIIAIIVIVCLGENKKNIKSMFLPITMMLVVCFFNNANLAAGYTIPVWNFCVIILFYCLNNTENYWHIFLMKLMAVIGFFYSFTTILALVYPPFFTNVCIPFFAGYGYGSQMLSLYQQGYITGFAPHYSTNAVYLSIAFGGTIAYGFASNFTDKRKNILALMIFVSLLFTGKRAHSLFLIASLIVIYLLIHSDEPLKRWEKILTITITALVIFVIAAQFVPQLFNVVNRFIETKEAGDIEMGRGATRGIAISLWLEHPFVGIGWDAFKYIFKDLTNIFLNVHCVYIQLLCEVGIIGSIPFFVFFVSSLIKAIQLLKTMTLNKEKNENKHRMIIFSVYIQVFFLLYCFTGNPLYDYPTLFTYFMGCAISEYYWLNREVN